MSFFTGCTSVESVKKAYRELAMRWHPDRPGGDTATMQKINAEYLQLLKRHFGVTELWDLRKDDAKCFELFNGFIENGLITKVG